MLTRGQWKFIGVLVPVMIASNILGFMLTETFTGAARDIMEFAIPFVCGFAGIWLTYYIADRNHWL